MSVGCTACSNTDKFRQIQGCTVKNETDGDIEVEIRRNPVDGKESKVIISGLGPGQSQQVGVHSAVSQEVGIRNPIHVIKATLANGQQHEVHAPFDNVVGLTRDWLFSVDNTQIKSLHKLDEDNH